MTKGFDARGYRPHQAWVRLPPNGCAVLMCFEALESGEFFLQSIDYYWLPLDEKQRISLARQALDVFIEGEPSEDRWGPYGSLQAAVAGFAPTMEAALERARQVSQKALDGTPDPSG